MNRNMPRRSLLIGTAAAPTVVRAICGTPWTASGAVGPCEGMCTNSPRVSAGRACRSSKLIRQPTLVMGGEEDPIVPVTNARLLAGLIPHARRHSYRGGHLELITEGAELAPVVHQFPCHRSGTVEMTVGVDTDADADVVSALGLVVGDGNVARPAGSPGSVAPPSRCVARRVRRATAVPRRVKSWPAWLTSRRPALT